MQAVIFIGIQATGKSTFFKERFFDTHIRIDLDMLKTRHREGIFLKACLQSGQKSVVDNTNLTEPYSRRVAKGLQRLSRRSSGRQRSRGRDRHS